MTTEERITQLEASVEAMAILIQRLGNTQLRLAKVLRDLIRQATKTSVDNGVTTTKESTQQHDTTEK
jgi:hypothetical protein